MSISAPSARGRLCWSLLPLAIGAVLPTLAAYWVLSHRLKLPFFLAWPLVGDAYRNPINGLGGSHPWLIVPFCALAVLFLWMSGSAGRGRMIWIAASTLGLTCLCMVPQIIHVFKETYYHDDAPPFVELSYLFFGLEPLFLIGICLYAVLTWRALRQIVAEWKDPSKRWD